MMRLESRNALLARAIFASTWSDNCATTLAPTRQAGCAQGSRDAKDERTSASPVRSALHGGLPGAQPLLHPCWNHSAKLLKKTEVRIRGSALLKAWLQGATHPLAGRADRPGFRSGVPAKPAEKLPLAPPFPPRRSITLLPGKRAILGADVVDGLPHGPRGKARRLRLCRRRFGPRDLGTCLRYGWARARSVDCDEILLENIAALLGDGVEQLDPSAFAADDLQFLARRIELRDGRRNGGRAVGLRPVDDLGPGDMRRRVLHRFGRCGASVGRRRL